MIEPIQIIVALFALFAWSRALLRFKDRELTPGEFVFWSVIWFSVIIVDIIPNIINYVSSRVGINRPVDFLIYLSIIVLFYMIFRVYVKLDKFDQQMTKLVRDIAIKGKKK